MAPELFVATAVRLACFLLFSMHSAILLILVHLRDVLLR